MRPTETTSSETNEPAQPAAAAPAPPPRPPDLLDEVSLCASVAHIELDRARELARFGRASDMPLVAAFVDRGGADEAQLLGGLASLLDLPFLAAEPVEPIPQDVLGSVPPALAISHHVVPVSVRDGRLSLACADPFDWQNWDDLAHILGRPIDRVLCPRPVIAKLLKANYGVGADTVDRMLGDRAAETNGKAAAAALAAGASEADAANEPTVVNLVNQILADAIRAGATDIHFEPYEGKFRVRYRIDGLLEDVSIPVSVRLLRLALVSRIKVMSHLDITEKRLPQDGRCQFSRGGQEYDLRVSVLPGVHGEAVNIRLQSRQMVTFDLDALGYEPEERATIERLIARPHGLILVTGPTGSGKTTTLYTCLSKISKPAVKIVTIEDPVEYRMENILQMQVKEEIDFTFARALRSTLRHDPDVILVGEVRDRETADIAIRSSLTGHLVFATLHTNDAASAFTRLLDIGIEPFLVASSMLGVVAQRLVRKVCTRCQREVDGAALEPYERELVDSIPPEDRRKVRVGAGCEACRFTGYRGRMAIAEALTVTSAIRRLVQQREPAERIRETAIKEGMRSLRDAALRAAREGHTSLAEVVRVTQDEG